MMLTAAINMQLEALVNMIPAKNFPLINPPSPKELECLGLKLGQVDLRFKKGYMEVNVGYRHVAFPSDPKVCAKFLEYIRRGPSDFMDGAKDIFGKEGDEKLDAESMNARI